MPGAAVGDGAGGGHDYCQWRGRYQPSSRTEAFGEGKVSYDAETNTLTINGGLTNAGSPTATVIQGNGTTDVKIDGGESPAAFGLTVTGAKNVTVTANSNSPAIYATNIACSGDVSITNSMGGAVSGTLTVNGARNVTVTANSNSPAIYATNIACSGDVSITNNMGGAVSGTLTVTDASGSEIELTNKGDGKYTFTMPASKVTVKATFMEDNSMLNFFVDVPADAYYYDAVLWAVENGVTEGTNADGTLFSPNDPCTRAQVVTFLWRAAGCPAPQSSEMPFTDVAAGSYYCDAVLWAVENGITKGTSDTAFSPDAVCSRSQIVTFLWRAQQSPAAGSANPFLDVAADAYYTDAVLWAVENGVTMGTNAEGTAFSPDDDCTRAQIVTFLYRCLGGE